MFLLNAHGERPPDQNVTRPLMVVCRQRFRGFFFFSKVACGGPYQIQLDKEPWRISPRLPGPPYIIPLHETFLLLAASSVKGKKKRRTKTGQKNFSGDLEGSIIDAGVHSCVMTCFALLHGDWDATRITNKPWLCLLDSSKATIP